MSGIYSDCPEGNLSSLYAKSMATFAKTNEISEWSLYRASHEADEVGRVYDTDYVIKIAKEMDAGTYISPNQRGIVNGRRQDIEMGLIFLILIVTVIALGYVISI